MKKHEDRINHTARTPVVESSHADALGGDSKGKQKMAKGSGPRYRISVESVRTRNIDPDNLSLKFLIDALKGVVIPDDSAKYVEKLSVSQRKVDRGEHKETRVEVEIIEEGELA